VDLGDSTTLVALGAAALAALDLVLAVWLLVWTRRIRRSQRALLAGENADLVEFAVGMQARQEHVERVVADAQAALAAAQQRIDHSYSRRSIVRYDALTDAGGRQSSSIALVDEHGTGIVISAIQDRAYARVYVKDVASGKATDVALSPEETQAVAAALAMPRIQS
jgi:HAMP domain-containing protein